MGQELDDTRFQTRVARGRKFEKDFIDLIGLLPNSQGEGSCPILKRL